MSLQLDELAWTIAEGSTEEYQFEVRIRHFNDKLNTLNYPQRLNIFWNMEETFDNGYPNKEELNKLHTFEDRLIEAVEHDEFAIMSVVLTGNGQREFVFHTSDPQTFIQRLIDMPQEENPYPLEIHNDEDSKWGYYYNELQHIPKA